MWVEACLCIKNLPAHLPAGMLQIRWNNPTVVVVFEKHLFGILRFRNYPCSMGVFCNLSAISRMFEVFMMVCRLWSIEESPPFIAVSNYCMYIPNQNAFTFLAAARIASKN